MNNPVLKKINKVDKSIKKAFSEEHVTFPSGTDVLFKWLPVVHILMAGTVGIKARNGLIQRIYITILSQLLLNAFVESLKKITHRRRPYNLFKFTSFPSSHTATSFCGAQILYDQTKEHSKAMGIAGYSFAITTATLRLHNKKHWFSDVVAGAIIGIVTAKLAYYIYRKLQ